jgi:DNA (cytosine-5)-methyltransferase 1
MTLRHKPADVADAVLAAGAFGVRRLTPTECARLQGFPDDWGAGQSDSSQYRQYGNAVCVNVAEWIARRIAAAQQQPSLWEAQP